MGGIFGKLSRKRQMRVLLNGLDAAGKTTTLYKLRLGEVVTTIPTIGLNIETVECKKIQLVTWDIGGRGFLRPLYRNYYAETDAVVFVVDSNDKVRTEQAQKLLLAIVNEDMLKKVIIVIMANKQDLPGSMTPEEVHEKLDVDSICKTHTCKVFGTSATTGEGLYDMLDWLVEAVNKKQATALLRGKDECVTVEKDSKSSYFTTPLSYIKHVFSKV
ncbi:ADP-ribosylation factor-like [Pecten maximus]|uniref:ADP-ribosylation factor-like n=1 Tax=Pecten maximus TaxID=6579 RepID=UPI001457FDA7|nr:ADP-ribosylation factor-like [Pecten maximus]